MGSAAKKRRVACPTPRKAHAEVVALTVEQARALLAAAAGNRFEALFVLAVTKANVSKWTVQVVM